jgi:hypothetical protein
MEVPACPKCKGRMVQGFVPNYGQGGFVYVSSWVEGQPRKSIGGRSTKVPSEGGIPVGAFRCEACGFLEFYSDREFSSQ